MFLVTLIGSIIASLFALCGAIGGVVFFLHAEQGMDIQVFLSQFVTATWPLPAGCVLFVLMEILKELRALRLKTEAAPAAQADKKATATTPAVGTGTKQATTSSEKGTPVYFPVRETPQGPRIISPEAPVEPAADKADHTQEELSFFKTR